MFNNTSNNSFCRHNIPISSRTVTSYCEIVLSIVFRFIFLIVQYCNTLYVIQYLHNNPFFGNLNGFLFSSGIWFDSILEEIGSTKFRVKLFQIWDIWKFWIWQKMKFLKLKLEILGVSLKVFFTTNRSNKMTQNL